MTTRAFFLRPAAALFALVATAPLPVLAVERPPIEEILPDGATLVFTIRDVAQFRDALLGKSGFFAEPKVKELLEEFEMSPRSISESFKTETGLALEEVLGACEGSFAVALSMGADGQIDTTDDSVLAVFGVKDDAPTAELWKRVREKMTELRKDEIVRARDDDFEGADVFTLTLRQLGASETEKLPDEDLHFSLFKSHLVATNHRDSLEKTILALKGKEVPTLARKPDFKQGIERLGKSVDYVLALDAVPLIAVLKKSPISPEITGERMSKALGLDDFRGVYCGMRFGSDAIDSSVFVHAPAPRKGILKIFSPADSSLEPDRFAPADAIAAGAVNLSVSEIFSEVEKMLGELVPQQAAMLPMMMGMLEQQTQVNLKRDLLDLLTPPIYSLTTAAATPDGDPNGLIYFRSTDAKKALDSLKKLVSGGAQGMASLKESEYLGYKISALELGFGGDDESFDAPALAFAATDTHLFISMTGTPAIEDALRGIGKENRPLTATDEWKRSTAALSGQRWSVGFARLGSQWKSQLEMLGEFAEMFDAPELETLASFDPAVLAKYADVTAYEAHSDGAGIVINTRILPPAPQTTPSGNIDR